AVVRELAIDELLRDDADHLAAGRERAFRERAHQPDLAAAVDDAEAACGHGRPEHARRVGIRGAPPARRAAEHAHPPHRASVPASSTVSRMPRPFSPLLDRPERPADPAVRRANLRRIAGLFRGYRGRLGAVLLLILVSAALGVVPAFLLRGVLQAIAAHDTRRLSEYAGGMIAIAVVTGALGVWQTLLSNRVGQRVMHDLRTAVFRHLQRLSLAFFTWTRTGAVQSWISNDIGGVQNVVTSTAPSIV